MLLTSNGRESRKERERRGSFTYEQREREHERNRERGKISLKSNWRINEREQEKIDDELATSGEEGSEKQQGKTGVA